MGGLYCMGQLNVLFISLALKDTERWDYSFITGTSLRNKSVLEVSSQIYQKSLSEAEEYEHRLKIKNKRNAPS